MYVNDKLKLNVFRDVYIPNNRDLYAQFGGRNVSVPGNVGKSGDFAEPVNVIQDKMSVLAHGQSEVNKSFYQARAKAAEEARRKSDEAQRPSDDNAAKTPQSVE